MQAATRDQPPRIFLRVFGNELVDARGEANDLWSHVVDEHSTIHASFVEMFEKGLW